ncbi:hypothetical protein PYCC9005_004513 [Savitreella phatthalungensis]
MATSNKRPYRPPRRYSPQQSAAMAAAIEAASFPHPLPSVATINQAALSPKPLSYRTVQQQLQQTQPVPSPTRPTLTSASSVRSVKTNSSRTSMTMRADVIPFVPLTTSATAPPSPAVSASIGLQVDPVLLSMTPPATPYSRAQQNNSTAFSVCNMPSAAATSRRSSLSSIRTMATTHSAHSSHTNISVTSAKFERAYAVQAQVWQSSSVAAVSKARRHPSMSSQRSASLRSVQSTRTLPAHVTGKRLAVERQLACIEAALLTCPPDPNQTTPTPEAGSRSWLLAHERHLLKQALQYHDRAEAEWEAAQDWTESAHQGPVSKIFVSQPSRFGLTPEEHKHRLGQARKLANNALDLWRFSELHLQDAAKIRASREKLEADDDPLPPQDSPNLPQSPPHDSDVVTPPASATSKPRNDFQSWLKEVSRPEGSLPSGVLVRDDGSIGPATTTTNSVTLTNTNTLSISTPKGLAPPIQFGQMNPVGGNDE